MPLQTQHHSQNTTLRGVSYLSDRYVHAEEADFSSSLDKRLREVQQDSRAVSPAADEAAANVAGQGPAEVNDPSRDSFSDAGDEDIAKALASRIEGGTSTDEASTDETPEEVVAAVPAEDEYLAGADASILALDAVDWYIGG